MIIRLYTGEKIHGAGQILPLEEKQCHYLGNVLRLSAGESFYLFDGCSGEYKAEYQPESHKKGAAVIKEKCRDFEASPDILLLFAPLKKDNTDMVIQKATELGVCGIMPVVTEYTNSGKIRTERFEAQAVEAAEQCRRLDVPRIYPAQKLPEVLKNWEDDRTLFFLNERGTGGDILPVLSAGGRKAAVLIGPEGGFSADEEKLILSFPFVRPLFLGKRILRAETAAVAALSCWQAACGDWRSEQ